MDSDAGSDVSDDDNFEQQRQAAIAAVTSDELGGVQGRFKDDDFFLGYNHGENKWADETFTPAGGGEEMVLDLLADDQV